MSPEAPLGGPLPFAIDPLESVQNAANTAIKAREAAATIQAAVESRQFQDIEAADQTLGAACQSCHSEYREQLDGGGYRIRPGVI